MRFWETIIWLYTVTNVTNTVTGRSSTAYRGRCISEDQRIYGWQHQFCILLKWIISLPCSLMAAFLVLEGGGECLTSCACCRRSGRGRVSLRTWTASALRLWERPAAAGEAPLRCADTPSSELWGPWSVKSKKRGGHEVRKPTHSNRSGVHPSGFGHTNQTCI